MNRYAGCCLLVLISCILASDLRSGSDGKSLSRRRRYVVFPEGSTFSIALCMTMHTLTPDDIFTEGVNWGISYDLPNESKPILEPFLQLRKDQMKPANKYGSYGNYGSNQLDKNAVSYPGWSSYDKYHFKSGKRKYYKPDYYYLQRRHRRDLYSKLETIMNAMNFDGRACVLRALCEASQRLVPKGNTLVEEMIRISFSPFGRESLEVSSWASDTRNVSVLFPIGPNRFPLKRLFSSEPEEHHTYGSAHKAGHEGQDCASMFAGCSFSLIDMALGKYDAARTREPRFPPGYAAATDAVRSSGEWTRYNMK